MGSEGVSFREGGSLLDLLGLVALSTSFLELVCWSQLVSSSFLTVSFLSVSVSLPLLLPLLVVVEGVTVVLLLLLSLTLPLWPSSEALFVSSEGAFFSNHLPNKQFKTLSPRLTTVVGLKYDCHGGS